MSSMNFFPTLYEDELLYSGLARYHRQSGNTSTKQTIFELFGSRSLCATTTFPSNLDRLWEKLKNSRHYDPVDLIAKHTLLPYYAPFLPTERFNELKRTMCENNGSNIYMKLGKAASGIKSPLYLRYCPKCLEDDRNIHGEAYWHRAHQLEGVQICHMHKCLLIDSSIPSAERKNKHAFYTVEQGIRSQNDKTDVYSVELGFLLFISEQTHYLLNNRLIPVGFDHLHRFYQYELLKKGFISALGEVRCAELIKEFNMYYGEIFLQRLNCYVDPEKEYSWLHKLVRKPRVSCHPLRHMLLLGFLGKNVMSIYEEKHIGPSQPFGSGPWICLNKTAPHYKQPVISECSITRCSDTGKPVGTFSCFCGFVYSRRGPDKSDADLYRIGRIKSFGEVWEKKLYELNQTDISLRKKAEILGVDPKTVKRKPGSNKKCIQMDKSKKTKEARLSWINLFEANVDKKIVEIRSTNQHIYMWLYRKDRNWLRQYNAECRVKIANTVSRINWVERDAELAEQVGKVASNIRSYHGKPMRITKNEIGRQLRKLSLLSNSLQKLPKTQEQLNMLVEDIDQFQERRLLSVIKYLDQISSPPKTWEVKRISGLKQKFEAKFNDLIEREIRDIIKNNSSNDG